MQINMQLIFTVFPLVEGKSCVVLTCHEWNHYSLVHYSVILCVCSLPWKNEWGKGIEHTNLVDESVCSCLCKFTIFSTVIHWFHSSVCRVLAFALLLVQSPWTVLLSNYQRSEKRWFFKVKKHLLGGLFCNCKKVIMFEQRWKKVKKVKIN